MNPNRILQVILQLLLLYLLFYSCSNPIDQNIQASIPSENYDVEPAWSPCGRYIAFSHAEMNSRVVDSLGGSRQIWIADLENNDSLHFITPGMNPDWSPDGKWLIFNIGRRGALGKLKFSNTEKTPVIAVTNGDIAAYHPAWSPDGLHILYSVPIAPDGGTWKIDTSGRNRKRLVRLGFKPAWLPEGDKFVATFVKENKHWMSVFDTSGTELSTILSYGKDYCTYMGNVDVSPDGQKIAFEMITQNQGRVSIYTVNPDGTGLRLLTPVGGESPAWSPDGSMLSYAFAEGFIDRSDPVINHKIWIMNQEGFEKRPLTY